MNVYGWHTANQPADLQYIIEMIIIKSAYLTQITIWISTLFRITTLVNTYYK